MLEGKQVQQYKIDAVKVLKERFEKSNDFIFTDYRGLTVEQITLLRNKLREQQAEYKVIKNRFAKIAFKELDHQGLDDFLIGPTAVALPEDESGPIAKTLVEMAKDMPLDMKGALIGGNIFDKDQIVAFSKLPSKAELYAILMGTMNAPLQNLVYGMTGVITKFVRTLQAVADQKGSS